MGWGWAGAGVISKTIILYYIILLYKYIIKGKISVAIWAAVRAVWAATRAVVVLPLPSALASWSLRAPSWSLHAGNSQKTGLDRLKPVFCSPKTSYNQSSIVFGCDAVTGFMTKVYW